MRYRRLACLRLPLTLLFACCAAAAAAGAAAGEIQAAWVMVGAGGRAEARVVTTAPVCPSLTVNGMPRQMNLRVPPNTPGRSAGATSRSAEFPVGTCEYPLPAGTASVSIGGRSLPLPKAEARRIVIIGDTGCRMKAAEDAFQSCNDEERWPFETVSKAAAAWRPDLVVHLGDIHYRESPCPADKQGCAASPWGYGYDAWKADFFKPGQALLEAAPWLAVRGNHESCARAGQGWFRFLDPRAYEGRRSCDDPAFDGDGDYSEPYAVPIAGDTQLIVFDSSRAAGKPYAPGDQAYAHYAAQLRRVDVLVRRKPHNIFLSHHPVLGFASGKQQAVLPGNPAMQSVMRSLHPDRLFAPGIDLALHGHVHLFEAISFKSAHPSVFVAGNAGSELAEPLPAGLPPDAQPAPGAVVDEYISLREFGFLTMEQVDGGWQFTSRDRHGQALLHCALAGAKIRCAAANSASKAISPAK